MKLTLQEWPAGMKIPADIFSAKSRTTIGATLLLFVLLPHIGYSQVFDGLPITEQERHWFADIPACCGLGDADGTDWFHRIKGAIRAWPPVTMKFNGLPLLSTMAWIFVERPPRLMPIA